MHHMLKLRNALLCNQCFIPQEGGEADILKGGTHSEQHSILKG